MSARNPGIERNLTGVPDHQINSLLVIGMPWGYCHALLCVLNDVLRDGEVAPSFVQQINDIRDLLRERTGVILSVRSETVGEYSARCSAGSDA